MFATDLTALGDPLLLLVLVLVMLFAGVVHGTLGLGFPVVSTPILAALLDVRTAILLTLLPTVAVNIASIVSSRSGYRESLGRFWLLLVWTLIGGVAGTWLLSQTDPAPFKLLLAALILLFLWSAHADRIPHSWLQAQPALAMTVFGLAAGFSAGTTNVTVAVLLIYFLALELPRTTMVPIMNTAFAMGKLSQLAVLAAAGMITLPLVAVTLPMAVLAVGALLVGQKISNRVPVQTYRRWLRWLLMVIAAVLIGQFVYGYL